MSTTKTAREAELETEIVAMDGLADDAQGAGSYSAAVNARAKGSALRNELSRLRKEREAENEPDPLVRIQRLRRLATEAGSYTAAANLATTENQMAAERALAADKPSGMDAMTDDELVGIVEAAILALPDTMVVRIRDAAASRLEGNHLRVVGSKRA